MKKYFYLAAALLTFAACSSDEETTADSSDAQVELRLTSSLDAQTRATQGLDTYLAAGEEVHVWVDDAGTDVETTNLYENNVLTVQDDNASLSGGTTMYFPATGNNVNIYAIHGNLSSTSSFWGSSVTHTVAADQTSADGSYANSDLVYGKVTDIERTKTAVPVTLTHLLSKVEVVLKQGNGAPDIAKVEILNTQLDATFTPDKSSDDVKVEATGDAGAIEIDNDVTAADAEEALNEAIIVPQTLASGTKFIRVTTTEGGMLYYSLPAETEFQAGKKYRYTITANLTGLTVTTSIADWVDGETIEDSATMDDDYTYTEENGTRTYTVYSEAGLMEWSEYTRSGNWNTNCTLANDITLTEEWTAIGTSFDDSYTGTFDGDGYTISGLTIEAGNGLSQGLIGVLGDGGVVKNLTMANANISGSNGYCTGGVVGENYGYISNCCFASGTVSGDYRIGGVVGFNIGFVIACYAKGSVSGDSEIGGVVGTNIYGAGNVIACYSTASVTGTYATGGVAGNNDGIITACYATGTVNGDEYIGGVAGYKYIDATVTACYWNNGATNGIGYDEDSESGSDNNATYVDGTDVTWSIAASAMNEALTSSGWQYEVTNSDPPLTLVAE